MNVADVTAEGLCKLEAGGQDTRGRKFVDILRQLAFSVGYSGSKGGLSCKAEQEYVERQCRDSRSEMRTEA